MFQPFKEKFLKKIVLLRLEKVYIISRCKDKEIRLSIRHDPNFVFQKTENIYRNTYGEKEGDRAMRKIY